MGHRTAEKLSREAGRLVEWAPTNREYVVWPEGKPFATAKAVRKYLRAADRKEKQT